jgi:acyl carrier protein
METGERFEPSDPGKDSDMGTGSVSFSENENMNNGESVAREVAGIFSQKLHIDVPAYDSDLFETGTLDSFHLVELFFELEQQFGVRISFDENDLKDFRSIESIVLMITRKNGNGSH